jgi:hypothetical protein
MDFWGIGGRGLGLGCGDRLGAAIFVILYGILVTISVDGFLGDDSSWA